MRFNKDSKCIILWLTVLLMACQLPVSADAQSNRQRRQRTQQNAAPARNSNGSKAKTGKSGSRGGQKTKPETSADVKRREAATRKEIQQTKERIEANEKKVRSGLAELSRLRGDIEVSDRKVAALNNKVSSLSGQIASLETRIAEGNREVERMRSEYLKAIKKMRLTRRNRSMLAFIFSADNFNQGLRRMRYLRQFSRWKEERSSEINRRSEELKRQALDLDKARKEQQDALVKQRAAKTRLEDQSRRQDALVVNLRNEGAALNAHLSKKQEEANQLKGRIAALIAAEEKKAAEERRLKEEAERKAAAEREARLEEERKAAAAAEAKAAEEAAAKEKAQSAKNKPDKEKPKKEKTKKEKPKKEPKKEKPKKKPVKEAPKKEAKPPRPAKEKAPSKGGAQYGNFASMKGSLPRPIEGHFRITSPFGRHSLPELPDVIYDNPGIDVEVSAGATAKAVFGGKVSGVYMIPGFGNVVIVNHGNHYTVYGNLSSVSVKVGDEVSQGKAVGKVATDPDNSSYGSLHFEVWRNRDKLDPSGWIR